MNRHLAFFLQLLTEEVVTHLCQKKDITFVNKTLDLTNAFLSGKEVDPDALYYRLENLDEEDILTYSEFDTVSHFEVWACIINAVAYICFLNYQASGAKYMPETIEAVDESTLDAFFDNYQKCLELFHDRSKVKESILKDKRLNLEDDEVKKLYEELFS